MTDPIDPRSFNAGIGAMDAEVRKRLTTYRRTHKDSTPHIQAFREILRQSRDAKWLRVAGMGGAPPEGL